MSSENISFMLELRYSRNPLLAVFWQNPCPCVIIIVSAIIWGSVARCYGYTCKTTESFRMLDAAVPMGFCSNMADTTNATYDGGIDVPHVYLSGAKISIIPETSKKFPKFNIKQRDVGLKSHVPYVLSYYNIQVQILKIKIDWIVIRAILSLILSIS